MKIGIMQPYFLPYLAYFQLISSVDIWVNLDYVTFIKQGYIHRNLVRDEMVIRVPCVGASSNTRINQIGLNFDSREWSKQTKTLDQLYSKFQYYDFVKEILVKASESTQNLSEFNFRLIQNICAYLDIETELYSSSEGLTNRSKTEAVLEIVRYFKGSTYINSIGGKDLYEAQEFRDNGIELKFLQTSLIEEFKSLSVFHILAKYPKEMIKEKLNNYTLV
jgi:hypothetical protein